MKKFLIFDNVISENYLRGLVDNIFNYNWKFSSNITFGDEESVVNLVDFEYGFYSELTIDQKYFILPLIYKICDLSNIEVKSKAQILRMVPRLQTMMSHNNEINDIHLDMNKSHYVIIFYPHDIDGETILYDQTTSDCSFLDFSKMSIDERKNMKNNFTILKKIKPKKNRAFSF